MKQEFYYQQMNKAQQNAYRAMLDGFASLSPEFPVLRLDGKELSDIFFRLRLDHPAIFYVEGFHYRFAQNSEYVQMIPEYMFEKKKIKEMKTALHTRPVQIPTLRGSAASRFCIRMKRVGKKRSTTP